MQTVLSCIAFVCVRLIHCAVRNFCVSFRQKLSTVLMYFIMLYSVNMCMGASVVGFITDSPKVMSVSVVVYY